MVLPEKALNIYRERMKFWNIEEKIKKIMVFVSDKGTIKVSVDFSSKAV